MKANRRGSGWWFVGAPTPSPTVEAERSIVSNPHRAYNST